jgi:hypothetical protein
MSGQSTMMSAKEAKAVQKSLEQGKAPVLPGRSISTCMDESGGPSKGGMKKAFTSKK